MPKRFSVALTEKAYARLRDLATEETALGNNYTLTLILENWDEIVDEAAFKSVLEAFWAEYGKME